MRDSESDDSFEDIKAAEYAALCAPEGFRTSQFSGTRFNTTVEDFGHVLSKLIRSVSLINRLREVRAFRGFHRLRPGGADRLVSAGGGREWRGDFPELQLRLRYKLGERSRAPSQDAHHSACSTDI
jgi:hypothetical protein